MSAKRKLTIGVHTGKNIMEHSYNSKVAIDMGHDIYAGAVFKHLAYNVSKKLAREETDENGEAWFAVSESGIARYMPELTPAQARKTVKKLVDAGLIKKQSNGWKNKYTLTEIGWDYCVNPLEDNVRSGKSSKDRVEVSPEVKEIVAYLNAKAGTQFRADTVTTNKLIGAVLHKGITVDECKAVIDLKVVQWKGDDVMEQHLTPKTLFGSKFEKYLEEVKRIKSTESQTEQTQVDKACSGLELYYKMAAAGLIVNDELVHEEKYRNTIRPTLIEEEQAVVDSWYSKGV